MKILVDADACPVVKIVERVAKAKQIPVTLFCDTNHVLFSDYSEVRVVGAGADAVDLVLTNHCKAGDVVVTQDYGLAALILAKKASAIHQNGRWYTNENIDRLLAERALVKKARRAKSKNHLKGPAKRTKEDDERFEASFTKLLDKVIAQDKQARMRQATAADFAAVVAFYDTVTDEMADSPYKPGWEKRVYPTLDFLRQVLDHGELYLATKKNSIVGAMVINHHCTEGYEKIAWGVAAEPEEVTVIHALGVLPACQGQGIAKDMVLYALDVARKLECKTVRLDVLGGNVPALNLYQGLGFEIRGTLKLFYEDTGLTDFTLMEYGL